MASILLVLAADLEVADSHGLLVCLLDLVVVVIGAGGAVHHAQGHGRTGSVVEVFVLDSGRVVPGMHSCRYIHHAAESVPICLAGRSSHHHIARSLPDRSRSHSSVGRNAGRIGCHSPSIAVADAAAVAVVVAVVDDLDRSKAVVRAVNTAVDTPWRVQATASSIK